jgi:hypothetical protein
MSNEINLNVCLTGLTLAAIISSADRTQRWNGTAMAAKSGIARAAWATGAIAMTEVANATAGTGEYIGSIPAGLLSSILNIDIFNAADLTAYAAGGAVPQAIGFQAWPDITQIKAKTDLISAGKITVISPLTEDGELLTLVVGDDYYFIHARSIDFKVPGTLDLAGATCTLRILSRDTNSVVFTITGTIIPGTIETGHTLRYEVPRTETVKLSPANIGTYIFSAKLTFSDGQIATEKRGQVLVLNA